MELLERAVYFIAGGGLGFVLGFIVARLGEIKEELDDVDECVKKCREENEHIKKRPRARDERGIMRFPVVADILLLVVVVVTAYAAFASQKVTNEVESTQDSIATVTMCNQEFLSAVLIAVNERTTFTADQARANIDLQRAQTRFLSTIVAEPPKPDRFQDAALREYFDILTQYIEVNGKAAQKAIENPYPTIEQFNNCLEEN